MQNVCVFDLFSVPVPQPWHEWEQTNTARHFNLWRWILSVLVEFYWFLGFWVVHVTFDKMHLPTTEPLDVNCATAFQNFLHGAWPCALGDTKYATQPSSNVSAFGIIAFLLYLATLNRTIFVVSAQAWKENWICDWMPNQYGSPNSSRRSAPCWGYRAGAWWFICSLLPGWFERIFSSSRGANGRKEGQCG